MKYVYLLNNKNTNCFVRLMGDFENRHYVVNPEEATEMSLRKAKSIIKKFKHPENWQLIKKKKTSFLRTKKGDCYVKNCKK